MVPSARQFAASLIVVASLAAGCTQGSDAVPDATAATTTTTTIPADRSDGKLTIGVMLPLTGDGATLGEGIRSAIDTQVDTINTEGGVVGKRIRVFYVDEARSQGLDQLLEMLNRNSNPVDAVVGPVSSLTTLRSLGQIVRSPNPVPICSPSATALSLDDFKDGNWFFRTVPSDSLLMDAMAVRAQATGKQTVAVIYLDDPYGRGLSEAFIEAVEDRGALTVTADIGLDLELTGINGAMRQALVGEPGIVVVLADEAVGGSILAALNSVVDPEAIPQIIVNDSVRTARQAIEAVSPEVRQRIQAVAPMAVFGDEDTRTAPFAVQAVDCINLIALASELSGSDRPEDIRSNIQSASVGGSPCNLFSTCAELIQNGQTIDYTSQSGPVDLGATGDPLSGRFESVKFNSDGTEEQRRSFEVP